MRKKLYVISAMTLLGLIAGAGVILAVNDDRSHESTSPPSVETVTAEKTDLVERVEAKGVLAYGVSNLYGTQLAGTLTAVASPGSVLSVGSEMMRVDDAPVLAMRGDLPAWRAFEPGMSKGRDVRQLEQNLASLGYFGHEPNEVFDWNTAVAVAEWQKALGLGWCTTLELGRVSFIPTDVRVSEQKAHAGDAANAAVLSASGTAKLVTVQVPPSMRDLLPVGAEASIALPDGTTTMGVVQSVEPPVEKDDKSGQKTLKVPVTLTLSDPAAAEAYSDVTVSVLAARTIAEDVLTVPVGALLAGHADTYAVEVVDGTRVTRVSVQLGAFADGQVEIKGGKLHAGDKVVVSE